MRGRFADEASLQEAWARASRIELLATAGVPSAELRAAIEPALDAAAGPQLPDPR